MVNYGALTVCYTFMRSGPMPLASVEVFVLTRIFFKANWFLMLNLSVENNIKSAQAIIGGDLAYHCLIYFLTIVLRVG